MSISYYAKKAEITYTKLTKELFELDEITYKKCLVLIRKRELTRAAMRIKKINKPTRNGTRIVFELISSIEEGINETIDIYQTINKLNMSDEELSEG